MNSNTSIQVGLIYVGDFLKVGDMFLKDKAESHVVIHAVRHLDELVNPLEECDNFKRKHKFNGIDMKREWITPQTHNVNYVGGGYWNLHRKALAAVCEILRQRIESDSFYKRSYKGAKS